MDAAERKEPAVHIVRDLAAPRALVFRAWSEPEQLSEWFAPHGCTLEIHELDFRTHGRLHMTLRNPQAHDCRVAGIYQEIVVPKRIVHTMFSCDEAGEPLDAAPPGTDPQWPAHTVVSVTFDEIAEGTRVTLRQAVAESLARRTGAYGGWLEMLERLAERLRI